MLKRIRILNYKSLKDTEVKLQPLTIVFGPNSVGKSNFLDALQLLSRLVNTRTLKDAFEPPYRGTPLESFTFGNEGITGLLKRDSVSFSLEVDVELSPQTVKAVNSQISEMKSFRRPEEFSSKPPAYVRERYLRYRVEIEISPKKGFLRVADEYLAALNVNGEVSNKRKPFLELMEHRFHLRMEGQAHPTYLERYLDHTILSLPHYPPYYPHLVALKQELASWFVFYFEPRERMRATSPVKEVNHIGLMGEDLAAYLNTLRAQHEPQFRAVEKSLHTIIPSISGLEVEVNNLGEVELRIKEGDTPIPARLLSEGTLRVLGLLSLEGVKERPSLIGLEEPENGVHPRRLNLIAKYLKTRAEAGNTQFIVTTHSPLLPDLIPDQFLYACKRTEGSTIIERFTPELGSFTRATDIDNSLNEEEPSTVSERILRGDFDA